MLRAQVETLIKQNNAIDIYEEYFAGAQADHSSEQPYARTLTVFRDPSSVKRSASYISWYPDGASDARAAAISLRLRPSRVPDSLWRTQGGCCILYHALSAAARGHAMQQLHLGRQQPQHAGLRARGRQPAVLCQLQPQGPQRHLRRCVMAAHPGGAMDSSRSLRAGMYNGQIAYWDTRKGHTPCDSSPIERSHRDPVHDMAWLQSKTASECTSVSTDGYVHWWDTRRLSEPVESLLLTERGQSTVLGAVSLEYEAVAGPTKFMVGTEQGVVLSCNRKAKTPAERIGASYGGHHGPVYSLKRHPFFPKYFMSVGDWTARVWMEDLRSPVMTTRYHASYLNGGTWSPTRPGVFFTVRMDGVLDVWDYFYKQNDPALSVQVTDKALTSINVQDTGRLVTVGAADGSTTLLELCEGLVVPQPNEKQGVGQMFERETKREKNLELRARELKLKAKRDGGKQDEANGDDDESARLRDLEAEFYAAVGLDPAQASVAATVQPPATAPEAPQVEAEAAASADKPPSE